MWQWYERGAADTFKVTVDLQKPNFAKIFFFVPDIAKIAILMFGEKSNLKSFNDREISEKNFFGEESINN